MKDSVLFHQLMESLNELIYFKDTKSRFVSISKSMAERFGLDSREEAIGKTDFDFFEEHHAKEAYDDEQKILESGKPIRNKLQKEYLKNPNRIAWSTVSKFPLHNEAGELVGTYGISIDITKEKEISEKLEQSYEDFRKFSEQVPGFFYMFKLDADNNASFPFASEGIKEVFELEPEDVEQSAQPVIDLIHEDDLARVFNSIKMAVLNQETWRYDYRVNLPTKGLRWLRGRATPELQEDGSTLGYGYITDITYEKNMYLNNVQLRRQFQAIFNSVPNLIFVKDIDGKYVMANQSAAKYFGVSPDKILGMKDTDMGFSEEKAQTFNEADKYVIQTNEPLFIPEDKSVTQDGEEVWHQTIKVPFDKTGTDKPAVLSIVTDITRRKNKESELNNSLNIIGEQNKRLMNFAHIVSHNLRNHAGNIQMLLSLYEVEESEEEKEELMTHLSTASKRLNETIADLNEIIDQQYSSSDHLREINLKDVVNKIKEILTSEILENQVSFVEKIPDDLSLEYNASYLESILLNLLSNAIKYRHPDRKPKIHISAYQDQENVYLEVTDNGLGIDLKKFRNKLFGMYNTFHNNDNSKGIGLFITKNQVESMGGSIDVQSEPGVGTTFKIQLT